MDTVELYMDQIREWLALHGTVWGARLIGALLVLLIGRWIARWLAHRVSMALGRSNVEPTLANFLARILGTVLLAAVVLAALDVIGIHTTSLVAIIGAAGLAVGLALQGSLSNFAAGVMIITFRPFRVGHFIEAGGVKGIVEEISIFHTILRTPDNLQVIVPNSKINDGAITNFSIKTTRRIDLTIGVAYDDDLEVAQQTIRRVVESHDKILNDPPPIIGPMNLASSAVEIVVWAWVEAPDFLGVKFYLVETLKSELEKAGCSIPFQQHDVHLFSSEPKPSGPARPAA